MTPVTQPQLVFWLSLSLIIPIIYGIQSLQFTFSHEYIIPDDGRQHVFWMQRFIDPDLFPHDLIADYFQSVVPPGYTLFYRLFAGIGIEPLLLNKVLPTILGLIATGYCFGISLQFLPVPGAGFITALLLNQVLWIEDDLISATPRAFAYPLFLAFLHYLLRGALLPCLASIALLELFYPQIALVALAILTLRLLSRYRQGLQFSPDGLDDRLWVTGLFVVALMLLPYALHSNEFNPQITVAQAKFQPVFHYGEGGRAFFFSNNPLLFWLFGPRSGLLSIGIVPPTVLAGLMLPVWLKNKKKFPLAKLVSQHIEVLPQILLASIGLFFLAHALLFRLHLPNRYIYVSFRLTLVLAAGIALTLWLDVKLRTVRQQIKVGLTRRQVLSLGVTLLVVLVLILVPFFPQINRPNQLYVVGKEPELYKFLQQQPKDILIASISEEASNIPTFARRSILVGSEYSLPYHLGYYEQFRQRAQDLIKAQYSSNFGQIEDFITTYGVEFWLLDRNAFEPDYVANQSLIQQFMLKSTVLAALQREKPSILSTITPECSVLETEHLILLKATCIIKRIGN
ncbi:MULTISPECIES: hypothetical protein [unclassified Coleofasciculus]|uniref:hypothetical protein n=1 Tax=unclassified Coleofasciculus TaxID=2692782 RepID=UPI001880AA3F|nr:MULTISPECIES: hypothetical protein [unclassified Coleofasciculus]MBE9128288.1 hypothetical protein [Coleofasciculus sp. LEGE 07081]MBE9151344.1 hypothetical protein [Coleofasciculus sp. LEGE 07092]